MPQVTVYATTTCPYCKLEKEWLSEKGVAFENVFVDQDPRKAEEMIAKSGQMTVPVTVIKHDDGREEVIVGFDQALLVKLLGLQ